jgi:hypothetical protein
VDAEKIAAIETGTGKRCRILILTAPFYMLPAVVNKWISLDEGNRQTI